MSGLPFDTCSSVVLVSARDLDADGACVFSGRIVAGEKVRARRGRLIFTGSIGDPR